MALRFAASRGSSHHVVKFMQTRGMATEKQIWNQIQSTKNIRKITASMKMVSAAKLKGDEGRLAAAIPFNAWTTALSGEPKLVEDATFEELPQKCLILACTSDKGLCGGVNSFITRSVKASVASLHKQGKECNVAIIGDKGRAQIRRLHADYITTSVTELVSPGNFALASAISAELIAAGAASDYDAVVIIYNSFANPAVYNQMYKVITPMGADGENEAMMEYEFEPDTKSEVIGDLHEYLLTSQIFHSLMDAATSEQGSRMTAMENASKNAGEMIDKLTLKYNRARQSRITTELIEIISGASALEDK